ncbi:MAG: tetratricopeptide repeat protein, partial [Deltaproteobacteria bacterium]|nr:tetratricopeptide repeat protein [Deltaproteobacteria bacterium]
MRLPISTHAAVALALALFTAALFAPAAGHDFLLVDDPDYVTQNPKVRGFSLENLQAAFSLETHLDLWIPLTLASYMADYELWGLQPGGYHLTNVLLHALAALLWFLVLSRATKTMWPAALAAALFAVHPLRVESVAWVAERKDVLSGVFWVLCLGAWFRYAERRSPAWYAAALAFCALGLMAKAMLVTMPFFLLLMDWWPLSRFPEHWASSRQGRAAAGRLALEKVPFALVCGLAAWANLVTASGRDIFADTRLIPLSGRAANALASYATYLAQTVWPAALAMPYPYPFYDFSSPRVGAGGLLMAGITAACLAVRRQKPYLAVGWFWFLGTLVPVIGLTQAGMQAHADRFTYVPQMGLFVMAAWGAKDIAAWRPRLAKPLAAGLCAALAVFSAASLIRLGDWKDTKTLFSDALEKTRNNFEAHHYLGIALSREGRFKQAAAHYEQALAIRPGFSHAHSNAGMVYWQMGDREKTAEHLLAAVRISPGFAEAQNNLGALLAEEGNHAAALPYFFAAIRSEPGFAQAHANLGRSLFALGRVQEAKNHLTTALNRKPDYARAWHDLGVIHKREGEVERAQTAFSRACALAPEWEAS